MEAREIEVNESAESYSFERALRWYKVIRREAVCIEGAMVFSAVVGFFLGFFMFLISLTIPVG